MVNRLSVTKVMIVSNEKKEMTRWVRERDLLTTGDRKRDVLMPHLPLHGNVETEL